jgi:hypothetical protein
MANFQARRATITKITTIAIIITTSIGTGAPPYLVFIVQEQMILII